MHGKARKRVVLGRSRQTKPQIARKKAQAIICGPYTESRMPSRQWMPSSGSLTRSTRSPASAHTSNERLLTRHYLSAHRTTLLNRITCRQLRADACAPSIQEPLQVGRAAPPRYLLAGCRPATTEQATGSRPHGVKKTIIVLECADAGLTCGDASSEPRCCSSRRPSGKRPC
jgi:hypothetical protein